MKKALTSLLFSLLTISLWSASFQLADGTILQGKIILQSEACTIIEQQDEYGNPVYWVLAEIANALLPEASRVVCFQILGEGNEEICNSIADGVDFLTNLVTVGSKTFRLASLATDMMAGRNTAKSYLHFSTHIFDAAISIKNTLDAYNQLGIIPWQSVDHSEEIIRHNRSVGNVTFENVTNEPYTLEFSHDGNQWQRLTIAGGTSNTLEFWGGYYKKSFGYCKGEQICYYQVYTNRTYKIKFDPVGEHFYLVQK